jgi:hypothetical protein
MKKLIFILCLFTVLDVMAQPSKKRRILFDADTQTPVDTGFYGIGIVDNQPYLINYRKDSIKFKMEYPYIRAFSTNNDLDITLTRNHPILLIVVRDSVEITLPTPTDTLNKNVKYDIRFLGWRGGTGPNAFKPPDTTFRVSFSDSVYYYYPTNKKTYRTKVFDHLSAYNFFRLHECRRMTLEILNNKWYLTLNDFEY